MSRGKLVAVELPGAPGSAGEPAVSVERRAEARETSPPDQAADQAALERWVAELEAYFRGERLSWSAEEVPLEALSLGPFEHAVYVVLLSIPAGATVAYGELAEMAGYPRAARAVGNVMAANPIPVVIPCHRVIRADGSLGNYGDDPAWKGRLLAHERAGILTSEVEKR